MCTRGLFPGPGEVGGRSWEDVGSRSRAEADEAGAEGEAAPRGRDDGRRTLGRFFPNLGRSAIGVFDRGNLAPLLIGGTATAIGTACDEQVNDRLTSEGDDMTATLSTLFGGWESVALIGSAFAAGRLARGERFRAATYDMAIASGVSVTWTYALKYAVGRERPNGEDDLSFPSGHTSNAFALAAALDGHYGKRVTVPAYTIAALVGYARLRDGVHWLSDDPGLHRGVLAARATPPRQLELDAHQARRGPTEAGRGNRLGRPVLPGRSRGAGHDRLGFPVGGLPLRPLQEREGRDWAGPRSRLRLDHRRGARGDRSRYLRVTDLSGTYLYDGLQFFVNFAF